MSIESAQQAWALRFATELLRLGTRAEPQLLFDMGSELWVREAAEDPERAAQRQFALAPPHDD